MERKLKLQRLSALVMVMFLVIANIPSEVISAATARATTMRLDSYTGKITVNTMNGSSRKASKGMRLLNGYEVGTSAASSAYINLDDTKAVKLDEKTQVQVRQAGKQLELMTKTGNIFFNVKKTLASNESFRIRSSTLITGVRGTSAYVTLDKDETRVYLLEGKLKLTEIDPGTGKANTVSITGGEAAVSCKYTTDKVDVTKEKFAEGDVPYFVLEEVAKDEELQKKVDDLSPLSTEKLLKIKDNMDQGMTHEEAVAKVEDNGKVTSTQVTEGDFIIEKYDKIPAETRMASVFSVSKDKTAKIVGLSDEGKTKTEITIPKTTADSEYHITEVQYSLFSRNNTIRKLTILADLETIPKNMCDNCTGLTEVTLSENITSIEDYAFYKCSNITDLTLPAGLTSLGKMVFAGCSKLQRMDIPQGVPVLGSKLFKDCVELTEVTMQEGVTQIADYCFEGCKKLQNANIPDGVTSIGQGAFKNCSLLESVHIPSSVAGNWREVFSGCSSIKNVNIPQGATAIDYRNFYNCTSLVSVTIPEGVTEIGSSAFDGCSSLERIELPKEVQKIESSAFSGCSSLQSANIPEGVNLLDQHVFMGCSSLKSITIPNSVTEISHDAFRTCKSLESITFADGGNKAGVYIGQLAFEGCESLTSITFPFGGKIWDRAFLNCTNLENVIITSGETSGVIGGQVFDKCTKLLQITLPKEVTGVYSEIFKECAGRIIVYNGKEYKNYTDLNAAIQSAHSSTQ